MRRFLSALIVFSLMFTVVVSAKEPAEVKGNKTSKIRNSSHNKYLDISSHWAEKSIMELIGKGMIHGVHVENNRYVVNPNKIITLAEYATILVNLRNLKGSSESFKGSKGRAWYEDAMDIAKENGLFDGLPNKEIDPQMLVTRSMLADITARSFGFNAGDLAGITKAFVDVKTSDWFYKSVMFCKIKNIIKGYPDNSFKPEAKITRAEAFMIIYNCLSYKESELISSKVFNSYGVPNVPNQINYLENNSSVVWDVYSKAEVVPSIIITSPKMINSFPVTTIDNNINIEGYVKGKNVSSISYTVKNDDGSGKTFEYVKNRKAVITSVYEENGSTFTKWSLPSLVIMDNANTVNITVSDENSNKYESSIDILKDIDSDKDSICDFYERLNGTNPRAVDSDKDGLTDGEELNETGTDPLKKDTDSDGFPDFYEVNSLKFETEPTSAYSFSNELSDGEFDSDGDGLNNMEEYLNNTDPLQYDTDKDGAPDSIEVLVYNTNPLKISTNGRNSSDWEEIQKGNIKPAARNTIKKAKSNKTVSEEVYDKDFIKNIISFCDLDKMPLKSGDEREFLIVRLQNRLNSIVTNGGKENLTKKVIANGIFGNSTKELLNDIMNTTSVNNSIWNNIIVKSESLNFQTGNGSEETKGLKYAPYSLNFEIMEYKKLLDLWKEKMSQSFIPLLTIPSLISYTGEYDGFFDRYTLALLRLFQEQNGLSPSGVLTKDTIHLLKGPDTDWKFDTSQNQNNCYKLECIGENSFWKLQEYENKKPPVYYSQNHGEWSYAPYYPVIRQIPQKCRIMTKNGCGPTSIAMIVATLRDKSVTPKDMADFSMEKDCINENYDTTAQLYPFAAKEFGLDYIKTSDINEVVDNLRMGDCLALGSMGSGHFTGGGHLISIMGIIRLSNEQEDRLIIYDSNKGNKSYFKYGKDGAVVLSKTAGIVYARPEILQNEKSLGFWIFRTNANYVKPENTEKKNDLTPETKYKYNYGRVRFLYESIKGIRFKDLKTKEDILTQAYLSMMFFSLGSYGPNKNGIDGMIGNGTNSIIATFQKRSGLAEMGFNMLEDDVGCTLEEADETRKNTVKLLQKAFFSGENYNSLGMTPSPADTYIQNEVTKEDTRKFLESYGIKEKDIKDYEELYNSKSIVDDSIKKLKDYNDMYPELTEITSIGKSVNQKDLTVFKIGNGKKKIFINAEHHPREYIGSVVVINQIDYIIDSYKKNLVIDGINIKDLLNDVTFYFMPFVNPDGLEICISDNPGMYTNANGVNLNSNYDAYWHAADDGSSGVSAFSEPETKAVKNLCEQENFDISMAYHSAGEIIFWYFGQEGFDYKRDNSLANILKNITSYRLVNPAPLTNDNGGFKDWVVLQLKTPSFTIEMGNGAITKPVPFEEYETILMQNLKVPLYIGHTLSKKAS